MEVRVLFYGYLKTLTGTDSIPVNLPEESVMLALLDELEGLYPDVELKGAFVKIVVNNEINASLAYPLQDGDEVMFLYILGGG